MRRFLLLSFLLLAPVAVLACAPPEPTPTLESAPTIEVAPPPPEFVPTLTPEEIRARDESRRLRSVVRALEDEIDVATRWCWPESEGERLREEAWQLEESAPDAADWVARERQLTELEGKLRPILREAETTCDDDRKTVRRRSARSPVDLTDASVSRVALGLVSAFAQHIPFGLVTGLLCGRYMVHLTIRRGLLWGLAAAALAAPLAAFVPFSGT